MVKYLVENGADVKGMNTKGKTVLHAAATHGLLEVVKYLVESGADVKSNNTDGWTVLHFAAKSGTLEMVKYLVENGADVKGIDTDGRTVLHSAVTNSTLEVVKYCVEKGADVNGKDTNGWTVLHAAVDAGELEIVKYLLEQGADTTLKSESDVHTLGIDILKMAVVKNFVTLVNFLLEENIVVWRDRKFLVEGRRMSLLEWSIHLGNDQITTILKRSIKHREKIQTLKTMNRNQLEKVIFQIHTV